MSNQIYANVVLTNEDVNNQPIIANYIEEKSQSIINRADEYEVSVVRFSIPTTYIPLFLFEVQTGQPDINLGIYSITIRFGGVDYQRYVIFSPQDLGASIPPPPTTRQTRSEYYFLYSYDYILSLFNTTLTNIVNDINTAFPASLVYTPYFELDEATGLISLIISDEYYDTSGVAEIYFNVPMTLLFEEYSGWYLPDPPVNGKHFKLDTRYNPQQACDVYGLTPPSAVAYGNPPTVSNFMKITAEYQNYKLWFPMKSLEFTTNLLPVQYDLQPSSTTASSIISNNVYRNIITDFEPIINSVGDTRNGSLQYYPQGPYRMVSLKGTHDIRKIQISVYWIDKFNNPYPIRIGYGESLSLKLLFRKKKY